MTEAECDLQVWNHSWRWGKVGADSCRSLLFGHGKFEMPLRHRKRKAREALGLGTRTQNDDESRNIIWELSACRCF